MPHIHWVTRQNKLEIPQDNDEVNTREATSAMGVQFIMNHKAKAEDKMYILYMSVCGVFICSRIKKKT